MTDREKAVGAGNIHGASGHPQRHVVLLGAGSQLAPFITQQLAEKGWRGVAVSRRAPNSHPPLHSAFEWESLDITGGEALVAPIGSTIISLVPLWLLPPLILRLKHTAQVIAFSSTSRFSKAQSSDPAERTQAQQLASAEDAVVENCELAGIPWTILRPTMVYGSGRDRNVSAIAAFVRQYGFFPVSQPGRGLRQPVHAYDLAVAAVSAIENTKAFNTTFNLSGGETLSYRAMVERIFAALGRRPLILPVPAIILRSAFALGRHIVSSGYSPVLFQRMNQDLVFDSSAARAALNYDPRSFEPKFSCGEFKG